jgi:hypothetical protein
MTKGVRIACLVAIATICLAIPALAQISANLTGPTSGPVSDGIYMNPYYTTVGGVANSAVVCGDFGDDSYFNSTWNATVTSFSSLTSSNMSWGLAGANKSLYGAVGYLTNLVLSAAPGSTTQVIDTFALWAVFDPTGVKKYLASNPITSGPLTTAALCPDIFWTAGCTSATAMKGGLLYTADNGGYTTSGFLDLTVLSRDVAGTSIVCKAEHGCAPQEFVAVSVREGGAAIAYLQLAGLCLVGAILLRSRRVVTRTIA